MGVGVDRMAFQSLEGLASNRIEAAERLDLVAPELDPQTVLGIRRPDLERVAPHPKRPAAEVRRGSFVLDLDQLAQSCIAIESLADWDARRDGHAKLGKDVGNILHDIGGEILRERVLADGVRVDGRGPEDIRNIMCEVRVVPRPPRLG